MVILRSGGLSGGSNTRKKFAVAAGFTATLMITPLISAEGPRRESNVASAPNPTANTSPAVEVVTPQTAPATRNETENQGLELRISGELPTMRRRTVELIHFQTGISARGSEMNVGLSGFRRETAERTTERTNPRPFGMGPVLTTNAVRMENATNPRYQNFINQVRSQMSGANPLWAYHFNGVPTTSTPVPGQEGRFNVSIGAPSVDLVIFRRSENGEDRYYAAMQIGPRPSRITTEANTGPEVTITTRSLELVGATRIRDITQHMRAIAYGPNSELRIVSAGESRVGTIGIFSTNAQGTIDRGIRNENVTYGLGIALTYGMVHREDQNEPGVSGIVFITP